ncbi:hypothetical protein NEIPOLOT_01190 [Neisseria polysaccharea ATCC 43768]|nr:hypothetical protein NEIPOLOT_01190 [Neisseria polysaccharea ATCC 43768]
MSPSLYWSKAGSDGIEQGIKVMRPFDGVHYIRDGIRCAVPLSTPLPP